MAVMKTPGVYIVEKNAFPNSVVQVATAVPAFIGYTEKAMNGNLAIPNVPTRLTSMVEFHNYFGGAPSPEFEIVSHAPREGVSPLSIDGATLPPELPEAIFNMTVDGNTTKFELVQTNPAYALYGAMRLFFQNGGGACYVTSIGTYEDAIEPKPMTDALALLKKEPEPTMIVIPDLTRLPFADAISVQQQVLKHCGAEMKSRFAILDIPGGYLDENSERGKPVQRFRDALGTNNLDFGAAYYPWLNTSVFQSADFTFENIKFENRKKLISLLKRSVKSDEAIVPEIERVGTPMLSGDFTISVEKGGTATLKTMDFSAADESSPATELDYTLDYKDEHMPGVLKLDGEADAENPLKAFTQKQLEDGKVTFEHDPTKGQNGEGYFTFTVTDEDKVTSARQTVKIVFGARVLALPDVVSGKETSIGDEVLKGVTGAKKKSVKIVGADAVSDEQIDADPAVEKAVRDAAEDDSKLPAVETAKAAALAKSEGKTLTVPKTGVWTVNDEKDEVIFTPEKEFQGAEVSIRFTYDGPDGEVEPQDLKFLLDGAPYVADPGEDEDPAVTIDKTMRVVAPLYKDIMDAMAKYVNTMAPSAAMAGIYTAVDNSRGVWKAPANVSVNSVISPTVNIDHAQQENLNVSTTGKSINAIRPFVGEGTLVWGARTLDGNSLDWRYVSVRRTMIMIEESIRLASKAYVFEPNTANTWVTMRSMIENFLNGVWKAGGLAGAVPTDAFSVHVGLGETMTPEDILEGILRITVLVAVTRPAEFIEITFQQQMQKS
ncbi:MAG: phage tail sheath subtilisin-like domain-containing protein [Litoreibacter sp.]|nr:phage tail sheath subtilisin-like domain-containing protein [Litoreibacter sp.]